MEELTAPADLSDPFSAPVVYVGSTLTAEEVRHVLPEAIVRPPARRLDLYRDRAFGASTFVIIDGVFFQQLAIAPREVLDLLADGARVIGASSMGALRAAECWPRGMIGKGAIYRLFKRGWLQSDDEVAVSFRPDRPEHGSVALVNVRYAARCAVRARLLSQTQARALLSAAQALFFADRHWPRILADARISADETLRAALEGYDLKRADARRCLRYVASLPPQPSAPHVMVPRDHTRERTADPTQHAPHDAAAKLADWLLLSGRYRRCVPKAAREPLDAPPSPRVSREWWDALEANGELGPELFRYLAFVEGSRRAPGRAPANATALVRAQLASEHGGSADWGRFAQRLGPRGRRRLLVFSARLAAARCAAGWSGEPEPTSQGT
jgi:hypothetical protein